MTIAIIFVHYYTEDLLIQAIEAVLASNWPERAELEIIVVNNGSKEDLETLLPDCLCKIVSAPDNPGYAGGINLGVSHTDAEIICLINPDVMVDADCLPILARTAMQHHAIAGPRLFLDEGRSMILPCTEVRGRTAELIRTLAGHHPTLLKFARKLWRKHANRYWRTNTAIPCYSLSGALLVMSRASWQRLGPFDAGYRLYFEESDWLLRAKQIGITALYEPAAMAVHRYNQSAVQQAHAGAWMRESAHRFSRRHYGVLFTAIMDRLRSSPATPRIPRLHGNGRPEIKLEGIDKARFPIWIELSAFPNGFPGAAVRIADSGTPSWKMPADVWRYLTPACYILQLVDASGEEIQRMIINR